MRHSLTIACILAISGLCHAEEPGIVAADPVQGDRIAALRRAAEHLDAAGLPEDAAGVRQVADELNQSTDGGPRQPLSPTTPHVAFDVQLWELDRNRLRNIGWDLGSEFGSPPVIDSSDRLRKVLVAMSRNALGCLVAETRLVTVPGRAATYVASGTYKIKVELAPVDGGNGSLTLHWGAETALAVPSQIGPHTRAKVFGVQLATELKYGQTLVAQVRPWKNDSGEVPENQTEAIVMVVTPTLVNSTQDAVGSPEEAVRMRAVASESNVGDAEKPAVLRRKLDQLTRLQAEIAALRGEGAPRDAPAAAAAPPQVVMQMQLIQLDRARLLNLGIEWPTQKERLSGRVLQSREDMDAVLDALIRRGIAKEVATPVVATVAGREASVKLQKVMDAADLDVVLDPHDRGDGQLVMHWRIRSTRLVPDPTTEELRPRVLEIDTAEELRYGQTVIAQVPFGAFDRRRTSNPDEPLMVMLLTPTLAEIDAGLPIPSAGPRPSAAALPRPVDLLDPPAVDGPQPAMRRRATQR